MKRRKFLLSGSVGVAGLAGCTSLLEPGDEPPVEEDDVDVEVANGDSDNGGGAETVYDHSFPLTDGLDEQPMLGDPEAENVLITLDDPSCPFCADYHLSEFPQVRDELIDSGEVRNYMITVDWTQDWAPVASQYVIGSYEYGGTEALISLYEQYFRNQDDMSPSNVHQLSESFVQTISGVPAETLREEVENNTYEDIVRDNRERAFASEINAVPSFVLFREGEFITTLSGYQDAGTFSTLFEE